MNLDTSKWTPFKIGGKDGLFDTFTGGDLILNNVIDGDIPVISHTADNNGIKTYSSFIDGRMLFNHKKTISLADRGTFYASVQNKDFYIGTRVKALVFKDGEHSVEVLHFLATVINNESFRFCYGRNCTSGLDDLVISLPSKNGKPDYEYMDKYISSLNCGMNDIPDYFLSDGYKTACWYLDNVDLHAFESKYAGIKESKNLTLDTKHWKAFHLYDLFEINSGNKFDKNKMTIGNPTVNFVGRSCERNGVTLYVDEIDGVTPFPQGYLTVALGGEYIGSCFVQDYPFYTSQNVNVLIPLQDMDIYSKLFISHIVRFESSIKFKAFARELNTHIKTDFTIKLPVKDDLEPDFEFMSAYIKSLPFSINI